MKRYSAKLFFQFRVLVDGDSGKRRYCEERMILLKSASARSALTAAKRRGQKSQFTYHNSDGNQVYFEFIGVMDLMCLDPVCDDDEVWYDIVERIMPLERKATFIPPESELNAIRNERRSREETRPASRR